MDEGAQAQAELEAVAHAQAERDVVQRRLADARGRAEAQALAVESAGRLRQEAESRLARLEGWSVARLGAALTGRRDEQLATARSELALATTRLAAAEDRRAVAERDGAALAAQLDGFGDLAGRRSAALAAREAWLRTQDPSMSVALDALAAQVGHVREELHEIAEAQQAAQEADVSLAAAAARLDSAHGWSTYDTFFGGGLISSAIKHERMDDASSLIRRADLALDRLARELLDVDLPAVGDVHVGDLTRTLDIWFDNFWSDMLSRDAILGAEERVAEARRAVTTVGHQLQARAHEARSELDSLGAERARLLGG
jgi:hypothetical protein